MPSSAPAPGRGRRAAARARRRQPRAPRRLGVRVRRAAAAEARLRLRAAISPRAWRGPTRGFGAAATSSRRAQAPSCLGARRPRARRGSFPSASRSTAVSAAQKRLSAGGVLGKAGDADAGACRQRPDRGSGCAWAPRWSRAPREASALTFLLEPRVKTPFAGSTCGSPLRQLQAFARRLVQRPDRLNGERGLRGASLLDSMLVSSADFDVNCPHA